MTAPRYHINLSWSEADQCWTADVPDLPYCSAHGATPEDAARSIQVAIAQWLQIAMEDGDAIPPPRYKPGSSSRAA
ncbi:MAG: type II toxin-antitoxin system HicB family antitoxin [Phreatobacter sp.]|uniref:type II toxin-antitoxin system HicB family antitoxin n=1 Tax=Phreatobacter sp. TaxID=1966341 RepID=UPI0025E8CA0A|nr:type II toxin-antitoxin system HicB family antitoxin [Phreatobacter sp.]MDP2802719.1 type II toxin-antitoxin system HicB family antitoxin [Phreatobacter sp.]